MAERANPLKIALQDLAAERRRFDYLCQCEPEQLAAMAPDDPTPDAWRAEIDRILDIAKWGNR